MTTQSSIVESPQQPDNLIVSDHRASDYRITAEDRLGDGGAVRKFNDNMAALRLLAVLDKEERIASRQEQAILARYVGWGGLKNVFPDSLGQFAEEWAARGAELRELLSEDDYLAAQRSILDAHYTSETVVNGIYAAVAHMGFDGGAILEPALGSGNFFGLMPTTLHDRSSLTGIELDRVTSRIASHLYPSARVIGATGFQQAALPGYFDLVIGNPPFGEQRVRGAIDPDISHFSTHNYFFARSVDQLRPNGLLAMVVSRYFLDAVNDVARTHIGHRTEFLGAIRLPRTAFQRNALTEVTTDIVFLRKLPEAEWGSADSTWQGLGEIVNPAGGDPLPLNAWFAQHPEMMLGRLVRDGRGIYGGTDVISLEPVEGDDLGRSLAAAVARLPGKIYQPPLPVDLEARQSAVNRLEPGEEVDAHDIGSFFLHDGPGGGAGGIGSEAGQRLWRRDEDADGLPTITEITPETPWSEKAALGVTRHARLMGMTVLRDKVRDLLAAEKEIGPSGLARAETLRAELNRLYDRFRAKHGCLHDRANEGLFKDDPDSPLLLALEGDYQPGIPTAKAKVLGVPAIKSQAVKMAIFHQRVIPLMAPLAHADNPMDGLAISLSERGRVDLAHIAGLVGTTTEAVIAALHDEPDHPEIFLDPVRQEWVTATVYLSGDVKQKHLQAREAGSHRNAAALKAVFPEDIPSGDIAVRLGANWVAGRYYGEFIRHLLGEDTRASVAFLPVTGGFHVVITGGSPFAENQKWGTDYIEASSLIERLLNNKEIVIRTKMSDGTSVVNKEATAEAINKAQEICSEFSDWIMRDMDRREDLTQTYNDLFNTHIVPRFNGAHLTLPGKNPAITLRRHQRDAIWRGLQQKAVLLDHVVGSGKTFSGIAIAKELKRTGLSTKTMIVVPNHLVSQWAADFHRLYPGSRILAMGKRDFSVKHRRRMLARIATGDWDAVIVAHSSFGFMSVGQDWQSHFIRKQVGEIQESIDIIRTQDGEKSRRGRTLALARERLEMRLEELTKMPKDNILNFEELGITTLIIDESHEFKNLFFTTAQRGMLGLGNPAGSKKAFDAFLKVRHLLEHDRSVVFATGTPISNSLTEMYTLQRYMGIEELEKRNLLSFDGWLNNFGDTSVDYELDGTGVKYKQIARLRSLVNLPEVMSLYQQYADSVSLAQVMTAYAEENNGARFPVPRVKGGVPRENVVIPRSDAQAEYFAEIVQRATNLRRGDTDNMLAITSDARKAALDMRLIDSFLPGDDAGKTAVACRRIAEIHHRWTADKGTQLVFLDLSVPLSAARREMAELGELLRRADGGDEEALEQVARLNPDDISASRSALAGFSVYDDMRRRLVSLGVADAQIAFVHDYDTDEKKVDLFAKVNSGVIRVLLGSTSKMGAGTNVQKRLVALHHIDCPWRPSDIEQREGRIVRQGNELLQKYGEEFEVGIFAYATEQTYDARMWQVQEQKLRAIEGLRNYAGTREMEEVVAASASAAEMKAAATGNPLILEDVRLAETLRKMELSRRAHQRNRYDMESSLRRHRERLTSAPDRLETLQASTLRAERYFRNPHGDYIPTATINGEVVDHRAAAMAAIEAAIAACAAEQTDRVRPTYTVRINETDCTNREAIDHALDAAFGDTSPFRLDIEGQRFVSLSMAVRDLTDRLHEKAQTSVAAQFSAALPITLTLEKTPTDGAKKTKTYSSIFGKEEHEATVIAEFEGQTFECGCSDSLTGVLFACRRTLTLAKEHLAGRSEAMAVLRKNLETAQREIPLIEKELSRAWPHEAEYERLDRRHKEVRMVLALPDNDASYQDMLRMVTAEAAQYVAPSPVSVAPPVPVATTPVEMPPPVSTPTVAEATYPWLVLDRADLRLTAVKINHEGFYLMEGGQSHPALCRHLGMSMDEQGNWVSPIKAGLSLAVLAQHGIMAQKRPLAPRDFFAPRRPVSVVPWVEFTDPNLVLSLVVDKRSGHYYALEGGAAYPRLCVQMGFTAGERHLPLSLRQDDVASLAVRFQAAGIACVVRQRSVDDLPHDPMRNRTLLQNHLGRRRAMEKVVASPEMEIAS